MSRPPAHPGAPVLVTDALVERASEGAAVIAGILAAETRGLQGHVVSARGCAPVGGSAPLLGAAAVPVRALAHLLGATGLHRPASVTYLPLGGLSWTVLLRAVAMALVLRRPVTLLMLQRYSTPPRWLARPVRALVPVLATNADDLAVARRLGLRVTLWDPPTDPYRVSGLTRGEARRRTGLGSGERVHLHVGHPTRGRNLGDLGPLAATDRLVLVLSPGTPLDPGALPAGPGLTVVHEHTEVAAWYRAADTYVFPTTDRHSVIGVPLSVAEAVGNALPVVARRSAMTERWEGHAGVHLVDTAGELVSCARELAARRPTTSTGPREGGA